MSNDTRLDLLAHNDGSFVTPENVHEFRFDREYTSPAGRPVYVYAHNDGREVHVNENGSLYTSAGPKFSPDGRPTLRGSMDEQGVFVPEGTLPAERTQPVQPPTQAPAVHIEDGASVSPQMEQLLRIRGMDTANVQADENQPLPPADESSEP